MTTSCGDSYGQLIRTRKGSDKALGLHDSPSENGFCIHPCSAWMDANGVSVRFGSGTASPKLGGRVSWPSDNGHEGRRLLLVRHPGRGILVIGEAGGALQFVLRSVHDQVPFIVILGRDAHGVEGNQIG